MRIGLNNKGFTLVQVMVVGTIMITILMASTQATLLFVRSMIAIEKSSEAIGESQELLNQVRRSSQNLTRKRINEQTTFYRLNGGLAQVGSMTPIASYMAPSGNWLNQGASHPKAGEVRTALAADGFNTQYPFRIDSHSIEEHSVVNDGGTTRKVTKRILVARCGPFSQYLNLTTLQGTPAVTALYVMSALKNRPFITYDSQGRQDINCCPPSTPNCKNQTVYDNFFRAYSIAFDRNQNVVSVEEFPKSVAGNPVMGAGFGLYFNSANSNGMQLLTFTVANRCRSLTLQRAPDICSGTTTLQSFMNGARSFQGLLKIDTRSLTTTISNEIGSTGIISL